MKLWDKIVIGTLLIGSLVFGYHVLTFAGGVTDDNNGNQGDILVSTGENHGTNSVGRWTDPSDVTALKGDKGDTGATGPQGPQGNQGIAGPRGFAGPKGDKGDTGLQGIQGKKGDTGSIGPKGNDGKEGLNGQDGIDGLDGVQGIQGDKGDKGDQGLQGKDVDPKTVADLQSKDTALNNRMDSLENRLNKLEKTQFVAEFQFRIYDSKRLSIAPFFRTNFTRGMIDTVGVRFTIKLGASYEEKLIAKQNKRLDYIESIIRYSPVIEKTVDSKGKTTSLRITSNSLIVDSTF